jgi:hypothetical protein
MTALCTGCPIRDSAIDFSNTVVLGFDDLVGADGLGLLDLFGEVVTADQALGRVDRVLGVMDDVGLGGVADSDRAIGLEGDHAGGRGFAVAVRKDVDRAVAHHGYARIAGSQIDSDSQLGHGPPCGRVAPAPSISAAARDS